ncbi:MAG: hypothetical protein AAFY12_12210, partial [Pseudomonadota bacterium]
HIDPGWLHGHTRDWVPIPHPRRVAFLLAPHPIAVRVFSFANLNDLSIEGIFKALCLERRARVP